MRIDLPGGHWVELVEPMEVTEAQRRPLKAAYVALGQALQPKPEPGHILPDYDPDVSPVDRLSPTEFVDCMEAFDKAAVAFCVKAWDFPFPVTPETVEEIPAPVYIAIRAEIDPIVEVLFPDPEREDGTRSQYLLDSIGQSFTRPEVIPLLDLPEWVDEAKRLLALVELTHWTKAEIEETPAVDLDRLLFTATARDIAREQKIADSMPKPRG